MVVFKVISFSQARLRTLFPGTCPKQSAWGWGGRGSLPSSDREAVEKEGRQGRERKEGTFVSVDVVQ